jgi:hypothetical protein
MCFPLRTDKFQEIRKKPCPLSTEYPEGFHGFPLFLEANARISPYILYFEVQIEN